MPWQPPHGSSCGGFCQARIATDQSQSLCTLPLGVDIMSLAFASGPSLVETWPTSSQGTLVATASAGPEATHNPTANSSAAPSHSWERTTVRPLWWLVLGPLVRVPLPTLIMLISLPCSFLGSPFPFLVSCYHDPSTTIPSPPLPRQSFLTAQRLSAFVAHALFETFLVLFRTSG